MITRHAETPATPPSGAASADPKPLFRKNAGRVCEQGEREGVLRNDGLILAEDLQPILDAVAADMRAEARAASN